MYVNRCDPCAVQRPICRPACYPAAPVQICGPSTTGLRRPRYYELPLPTRPAAYYPLLTGPPAREPPRAMPPLPPPRHEEPVIRPVEVPVAEPSPPPAPVVPHTPSPPPPPPPAPPVEYPSPEIVPLPAPSPPRTRELNLEDGWYNENLKVLEHQQPRICRIPEDEWEAGFKLVPEADPIARDRHFHKVEHPYSWMDESMKVLPQRERTKYPNIYGYTVENTGWDSGILKTLDPEDAAPSLHGPRGVAKIAYAANHDWYLDGKQLPPEERFKTGGDRTAALAPGAGMGGPDSYAGSSTGGYGPGGGPNSTGSRRRKELVVANTGWDSGLKVLPPYEARGGHAGSPAGNRHQAMWDLPGAPSPKPNGWPKGYWDIENRKTLPPEEAKVGSHAEEGRKYINRRRAADMAAFHQRMCESNSAYTY